MEVSARCFVYGEWFDFNDRLVVRAEGLEPPHLTAPDPKSGVSANFTTRASGSKSKLYVFENLV